MNVLYEVTFNFTGNVKSQYGDTQQNGTKQRVIPNRKWTRFISTKEAMICILKYRLIWVFTENHEIYLLELEIKQNKTKPTAFAQLLVVVVWILNWSSDSHWEYILPSFFFFFSPLSNFLCFICWKCGITGKKFQKSEILSISSILHNNTIFSSFFLSFPSWPVNEADNLFLNITSVLEDQLQPLSEAVKMWKFNQPISFYWKKKKNKKDRNLLSVQILPDVTWSQLFLLCFSIIDWVLYYVIFSLHEGTSTLQLSNYWSFLMSRLSSLSLLLWAFFSPKISLIFKGDQRLAEPW